MMITLSARDFNRLSESSRKELLGLLAFNDENASSGKNLAWLGAEDPETDVDEVMGRGEPAVEAPINSGAPTRRVTQHPLKKEPLDISIEQAHQLIANVGALSKKTLRLLSARQWVSLNELIGPNADYADYRLLKNSLVGAVNRRLRTVTENRAAVLFVGERSKSRIGVRPISAAALRQALDVQEPMPLFDCFDPQGLKLNGELPDVWAFLNRVEAAWSDFTLRPSLGSAEVSALQIWDHLVNHGFKLIRGRYVIAENDVQIGRFEYLAELGDSKALIQNLGNDGFSNFGGEEVTASLRVFFTHSSDPEVFGLVRFAEQPVQLGTVSDT